MKFDIEPDGRMCIGELECLAYINGWRIIRPELLRKVVRGELLTEAELTALVRATPRGP